jgi:hypothetical protein
MQPSCISFRFSWFRGTTKLALFLLLLSSFLLNIATSPELAARATSAGPQITQILFNQLTPNTLSFSFQSDHLGTASMTISNSFGYTNTKTDSSNTSHSFDFYPLAANATYYYSFATTDSSANTTSSNILTFTTASNTNSFYFTNLSLSFNNTNVVVSWNTNSGASGSSATAQVDYGTDISYGNTVIDNNLRIQHTLSLPNLNAGTSYHFQLKNTDSQNNTLVSPDMMFTMLGNAPTTTATTTPPTTTPTVTTTTATTPTLTTATTTTPTITPTTPNITTVSTSPVMSTSPSVSTTPNPTTTTPSAGLLTLNQAQLVFNGSQTDLNSGLASQTLELSSTQPLSWWVQSFTNNGGAWLSVAPSSGTLSLSGTGLYKSGLSIKVQAPNLIPGQYSGGLFINNSSNSNQAALIVSITLNVTGNTATPTTTISTPPPTTPPASSFNYYLPYLSNGANGFTTYLTLQNQGGASASISLQYYDMTGQAVGNITNNSIVAGGQLNPPNGFLSGTSGSAQLTSSQPLNIVIAESTPTGGSAFMLNKVTGNKLIAPLVLRRAYGGFSSSLYLLNTSLTTSNITVSYYEATGLLVKTQAISLAGHASASLDQTDAVLALSDNFVGWALIQGSGDTLLCAQVLESNPSIKFTATFGVVAAPFTGSPNQTQGAATTIYAPAVFNSAFGSFYSGMTLVNPNAAPANVTVSYYDPTMGSNVLTQKFLLQPNAAQLIFHGDAVVGLPAHFFGSAVVTSDQALAGVLNENGGGSSSGTYNLMTSGNQYLYLPVLANKAFGGYISGLTVLNLTNTVVNFSLHYFDAQGNVVGAAHTYTLQPHGSQPIYQGASAEQLPTGFFGTAQLQADTVNSLAVTSNVANDAFFYTYTAP